MKKLLPILVALPLSACTTMSPCYNIQNHDNTYQTGVVISFGQRVERRTTADYTCPNPIAGDLLDPPLPFPNGNG